jgi:tetratricopeptide (TPR) repeat protein
MFTSNSRRVLQALTLAGAAAIVIGCEGINRKHDNRVLELSGPVETSLTGQRGGSAEMVDYPELIERMEATRQSFLAVREQYIVRLREIERAYLIAGDTVRADWARHQRETVEKLELKTYPYLTAEAPEQRVEVAPEQNLPAADDIYNKALTLLNEVRGVPLAGHLEHNKKKAREALELFRRVLEEYPKSDKVDDCAFFCGEIYKEYLRDDDPDDELAIRYYRWAAQLDPQTPHAARFQCAAVYDFRRHDRAKAIELYHQVLETEENGNMSNQRFAATRIEQLTDEEGSHLRPEVEPLARPPTRTAGQPAPVGEPVAMPVSDESSDAGEPPVQP